MHTCVHLKIIKTFKKAPDTVDGVQTSLCASTYSSRNQGSQVSMETQWRAGRPWKKGSRGKKDSTGFMRRKPGHTGDASHQEALGRSHSCMTGHFRGFKGVP